LAAGMAQHSHKQTTGQWNDYPIMWITLLS
jgi:hypothetical protein